MHLRIKDHNTADSLLDSHNIKYDQCCSYYVFISLNFWAKQDSNTKILLNIH